MVALADRCDRRGSSACAPKQRTHRVARRDMDQCEDAEGDYEEERDRDANRRMTSTKTSSASLERSEIAVEAADRAARQVKLAVALADTCPCAHMRPSFDRSSSASRIVFLRLPSGVHRSPSA